MWRRCVWTSLTGAGPSQPLVSPAGPPAFLPASFKILKRRLSRCPSACYAITHRTSGWCRQSVRTVFQNFGHSLACLLTSREEKRESMCPPAIQSVLVRLSPGSRINRRMRMLVSSLCITRPCVACRINSSSASRSGFAAAAMSSHCGGCEQKHSQLALQSFQSVKGHSSTVLQQGDHGYGGLAVLRCTWPSAHLEDRCLQRNLPMRMNETGSFCRQTFPAPHSGQALPDRSVT
jgi:hypothetical protein